MELSMDKEAIYLCMHKYIQDMLKALEYDNLKASKYSTPINKSILTQDSDPDHPDTAPLSREDRAKFMKGVGMLGWLKETARPDVAYAHSRISQHMANPNYSALQALKHCCGYLKKTSHLTLRSKLYDEDEYSGKWTYDGNAGWRF